ncbi:MAG: hypothetical protein O2794_03855 [bacterium]|nr:hypothetical protein [bacterium]
MPPPEHDKARDERKDIGDHSTNLYDLNESSSEEKIDPATGEVIKNDPATEAADEEVREVKAK